VKKKEASLFSRLIKYAGNYKGLFVLGIILSAASAILSLVPFLCIWFVVRDVFLHLSGEIEILELSGYGWTAVSFSIISIVLYFVALMCSHLTAFRVEKNMRRETMHKIVSLPLGFFKENTMGKLRKVIDDNASLTHSFLAHQLPDLSGVAMMPIIILAILFIFDWKLGLVSLSTLIFAALSLKKMLGEEGAKFMAHYMDALEEMNTSAVEYVRGIPVVKVFQQTVYSFKNFHKAIHEYSEFASDYAMNCRVPMIGFTLSINAPSFLLAPIGVLFIANVSDYKMFLLDLIFYMLFTPMLAVMMTKIMYSGENVMIAKQAVERIDSLLESKPLEVVNAVEDLRGHDIEFDSVEFSYPGQEQKVIDGISLKVTKGQTIALVGPSGGGKTTLANLAVRFWDVDKGSVKIGDVDVKNIDENTLMNEVAFVFQNSKLFKMSILENIRLGKPNASREEILKAAHAAQCDDILEKMPQGVDTIIGSEGVYLSGGEMQRVALARAILKDASIVILDEATAFADPENEHLIQKAFKSLVKDKTVLMIAHRLSSVKNVDNIVVIKDGKIAEQGKHDELLNKNAEYSKLWNEYQKSIAWKVGKEVRYA
jgi:ATP-binding cassette subfamily B protein